MLPNFPPSRAEIVTRRWGIAAAITITLAVIATLTVGLIMGAPL